MKQDRSGGCNDIDTFQTCTVRGTYLSFRILTAGTVIPRKHFIRRRYAGPKPTNVLICTSVLNSRDHSDHQ